MVSSRLFVFARHAESAANVEHVLSSDPARPVALTSHGREQARQLGLQIANLDIGLAIATSFRRTQETAELALQGRGIPLLLEPDFDDVRAGLFDSAPIETYWAWREQHTQADRLPLGESLDETLARYAEALERLLERTEPVTLVIAHELLLHSLGEVEFEIPNAAPHLLSEDAVRRAAARLAALTSAVAA
jgi:broad specificity phosphatase PhoE